MVHEMNERFYQFAGLILRVRMPQSLSFQENGTLLPFEVNATQNFDHTLEFVPVDRLLPPEGEQVYCEPDKHFYVDDDVCIRYQDTMPHSLRTATMRIRRKGAYSIVQVKKENLSGGLTTKMVLNSMEPEHLAVQSRGLILHASYICWNDQAILFTAPSGTGKSTQADLWCKHRGAELINGDRVAVMVKDDGVFACGIPFSGSSGVGKNVTLPLRAIVYLSQAEITSVEKLRGYQSFRCLWEGCSVNIWNREDVSLCTQTVLDILNRVPVFHLSCTPDEAAVSELENVL